MRGKSSAPNFDPSVVADLLRRTRLPVPQPGERFGQLTVVGEFGYIISRIPRLAVLCECSCGQPPKFMYVQYLRTGRASSCGRCRDRRIPKLLPGMRVTESPLYSVWQGMKARCFNPEASTFRFYGRRGITVCTEWRDNFRAFESWAMTNGYCPGLSIDRVNNNGNYEPANCRWTTPQVQASNTRRNVHVTAFGETKTIAEWGRDERCPVPTSTVYARMGRGNTENMSALAPRLQRTLTAFCETKSLKQWSEDPRCAVSYKVLWQRVRHGMPPESAITAQSWTCRYPPEH